MVREMLIPPSTCLHDPPQFMRATHFVSVIVLWYVRKIIFYRNFVMGPLPFISIMLKLEPWNLIIPSYSMESVRFTVTFLLDNWICSHQHCRSQSKNVLRWAQIFDPRCMHEILRIQQAGHFQMAISGETYWPPGKEMSVLVLNLKFNLG